MSSVLISSLPNILSSGYTNDDLLVIVGYSGNPVGVTYHTPLTSFTQYVSAHTATLTGASLSNGVLTIKTPVGNFSVPGLYDIYVTGGTYNVLNDTATFTNTTGGTFSVTGFTGATLPAGVNEDVQFNNNGFFGAASLKYRPSTSSTWNRGANNISSNTVFGEDAMRSTTGSGNTVYGYQSYYTSGSTGSYNTSIGYQSLYSNVSGNSNTAIGYKTQYSSSGSSNTSVGYNSLYSNTTGSWNTTVGSNSLSANTIGSYNIAIGYQSLNSNTTGSTNFALGYQSLYRSNSDNNFAIGYQSLYSFTSTTSNSNLAVGNSAMYSFLGDNSTSNLAVGGNALYSLINNSSGNTAVGYSSLQYPTTNLYNNTAVGINTGQYLNNGSSGNTFFGVNAGRNVSGNTNVIFGTYIGGCSITGDTNTFIGAYIGAINGYGNQNIAIGGGLSNGFNNVDGLISIGTLSMNNTPSGSGNIGIGASTLRYVTSGQGNTSIGDAASPYLTTGSSNTALGAYTLGFGLGSYAASTGSTLYSNNTAIGYRSLSNFYSGNSNTAIGYYSGNYLQKVSGATVIGAFDILTYTGLTAGTNVTLIGYNAVPPTSAYNSSDYIVLGNTSVTTIYGAVNLTTLSDRRDKKNIESLNIGIDFVDKLRPVTFEWDMRDGGKVGSKSSGFIAQEVSDVEKESGMSDYLNIVDTTDENRYLMTPGNLLPVLVKAIQDLSKEQKELEVILKGLENK
jgi:hypothetical protein